MDISIRECREDDLEVLESRMPTPGTTAGHARRFHRQQQGVSAFLVAWCGEVPVATTEIRWQGCTAPEVSERFHACPELNGLAVWPPELRSQGIGTTLVLAAEDTVRRRGYHRTGLGVDEHNHRSVKLYLRLGYEETGCHYTDRYHYIDHDGARHDIADPCRFLIKQLC